MAVYDHSMSARPSLSPINRVQQTYRNPCRQRSDRSTSKRDKDNKGPNTTLLHAAALQDHLSRRLRVPGAPQQMPSMKPGAELTLAQYFGLIPRPPALLTQQQWGEVQLKSRLRQDSLQECPICREAFQDERQVLLSCSHVFHAQCIASFERFARIACCPLCRCEGYQKRAITDGVEAYRHRCATRIQAGVRGWLARRRYKQLRRSCPPKDEQLRRRWAAERLQEESDRMLNEIRAETGDLDAFFAELDASVAESRAITDHAAGRAAAALRQRSGHVNDPSALGGEGGAVPGGFMVGTPAAAHHPDGLAVSYMRHHQQPAAGQLTKGMVAVGEVQGVDWDGVCSRAVSRGDRDCSICFGSLMRRASSEVAWLSCSHMFHMECITAFEAFETAHGSNPRCPMCRGPYSRICFAGMPAAQRPGASLK